MNEISISDLGFTWDEVLEVLKTTGIDFGVNVLTAITIFYIGRFVARLFVKGLSKVLHAQEVDETLQTFVSNLANMITADVCHRRGDKRPRDPDDLANRCTRCRRPGYWVGTAGVLVELCIRRTDRYVSALQSR